MGEELTKLEIGDISKLIAAIYITDTDFRKILLKSVMGAFKTSHQNTNIEYGFGGTKPDQHAIDYLQERVFILSDKTKSRLEGNLRFELLEGLKNNESIREITKRLDTIFSDMMPYQLERIARTEIIDAQNGGRVSAYKASGVVGYKMWIAAKGGKGKRVCALCARLNGQIQPIDKPFVDPETGESWQHPVAHPNGRCTTVPLIRLPDDVITVGGQMYAADKKVGKIEINTKSLNKNEKRVWIPPSKRAVGHWRKVKSVSEKPDIEPKIKEIINKTEKILSDPKLKDLINKCDGVKVKSSEIFKEVNKIYEDTEYEMLNRESRTHWLQSSMSDLSLILMDSIKRQFGGRFVYTGIESHEDIINRIDKTYRRGYPKDRVDKYIKLQKNLTRKLLDIKYPDTDEIKIYRGTTNKEIVGESINDDVKISENPLSSWTTEKEVAIKFSDKLNGIVLESTINKDDIWSVYLTHSYSGWEHEIIVIGKEDREARIIK